jgi:hypothetical protein
MVDVPRTLTFVVAWLAAAAVAGTIAWQGVGIVTRQVTDQRPASLTAAELRALAGASTTLPVATSTTLRIGSSPSTTAPTTTAPPTSPTTAPPAPVETRTYNLTGGSVALRFGANGVSVVWATPNAGFVVDVEPERANGVKVEFESESHRSRIDGWWSDGPQDRVREEPR